MLGNSTKAAPPGGVAQLHVAVGLHILLEIGGRLNKATSLSRLRAVVAIPPCSLSAVVQIILRALSPTQTALWNRSARRA